MAMKRFKVAVGRQTIAIYNEPFSDTTCGHLVDSNGERYESWRKV
jgi:hypothetical protein